MYLVKQWLNQGFSDLQTSPTPSSLINYLTELNKNTYTFKRLSMNLKTSFENIVRLKPKTINL